MNETMRYSKMSEEEAAQQFELRKQQLLGTLLEQYQSAHKKPPRAAKSQLSHSNSLQNQSEFVVFSTKKLDTPKQLYQITNQKPVAPKPRSQKKLQFIPDESPALSLTDAAPLVEVAKSDCPQPIQHPLTDKKTLLRDIGNIDLEIERLKKESSQPEATNPKASKAYFELRQRPSSKESRISDQSYTKRASCFKAVIRSASMKKLHNPPAPQHRGGSEKKFDSSINKTVTIESENKPVPEKKPHAQSERKIAKPIIQMNRSQSKQDTPKNREQQENQKPLVHQRSTPIKSILKVQFSQPKHLESSSAKNSSTFFHNHKESYTSQVSMNKSKCVEAQIEEAVQLYNNLKSLMTQKTSVLQLKKDQNIMPRKTADFFFHKVHEAKSN